MRKITLPALALAALIVTSCAKEKDGYDKNLTNDTWNLSTATIVNENVDKYVYTNGDPNQTQTSKNTTTISGGVQTEEQYTLNQIVNSADFFTKNVVKSDVSLSYKFEKEGTFSSDRSEKVTSTAYSETNVNENVITQTNEAQVSSSTGLWSWQNTGEQKSQLTFDLGSLQVVSIDKSELVLQLRTSSSNTSKPNSATTLTETETTSVDITMTR